MGGLRETNKFLTDSEPWKLKGQRADDRRRVRGWSCVCIFVCVSTHGGMCAYTPRYTHVYMYIVCSEFCLSIRA